MNELLKLKSKDRKGSKPRCHQLTEGSAGEVARRLTKLIAPWGTVTEKDHWMPEGFDNIREAQLNTAQQLWNGTDPEIGRKLQNWWLAGTRGNPRTPNFDIAGTCTVTVGGNSKTGLFLVEAKAHCKELKSESAGKKLNPKTASDASKANHEKIKEAIQSACTGMQKDISKEWEISRDSHYQMSNRFAWSWKLTQLGFPVILIYLGFLNAIEMKKGNKQNLFTSYEEWEQLVKVHSYPLFPAEVWNRQWIVNGQPFIPLIRSLNIAYDRPFVETEI